MKVKFVLFFMLLVSAVSFAQLPEFPDPNKGRFTGGFGMTWIDDEPHYTFRVTPDINLGKWGIGLDVNLDFDKDGKLRNETYKTFSQVLSIIRYVRYGQKNDKIFAKVGALDYYTLGQGNLISNYNNQISFDNRKTGLILDIDFDKFGFESIYSDFGEGGIFGLRGYARPLRFSQGGNNIPVLNNLEVGVSYVADFNDKAGIYKFDPNTPGALVKKDQIGAMSFDVALPFVNTSMFNAAIYANYTKFFDFGSGTAAGIKAGLNGLGIVSAAAQLERRFNNDKYIPAYFNSLYEVQRYTGPFSKAAALENATTSDNGWYGSLLVNVAGMFNILGSYQRLDKTPNSGILELRSQITPETAPVVVRAGYEKTGIQSESELFTADERSHAYIEAGYKPMQYILVSLVYHWTFEPMRDGDNKVIGYSPQKRIEPRVTFVYPFSVGN
ncbi:MAG: hypothetical protein HUU43_12255 [Ignavibacteriaceae bacterium]|nr:hypothetical protein [Ignavibacteriaceae bacterium]NUM71617.1 hypothetical protein [Ignavibacteriaceae bacterium]